MTDLDRWHEFEPENPMAFVNMYQFWVQKAGLAHQRRSRAPISSDFADGQPGKRPIAAPAGKRGSRR